MTDETILEKEVETTLDEISFEIKANILLKALEHTQTNRRFLITRVQGINTWIGSVLVLFIGGSAIFGSSQISVANQSLFWSVSLAIIVLFIFAWITEILTFQAQLEEGKSAVKIVEILHLFEAGFYDDSTVVFDKKDWTNWHESSLRRLGISPGTSVLFILSCIAILMLWMQV